VVNLALADGLQPDAAAGPVYAAGLLALNIVEMAGLVLHRRPAKSVRSCPGPVLISATALPVRLTIALGCSRWPAPRRWCSSICRCHGTATIRWCCRRSIFRRLAFDPARDRRHSLYAFQVTEEARRFSDSPATELVLAREQHLTAATALRRRRPELGNPLSTIFLISRDWRRRCRTASSPAI